MNKNNNIIIVSNIKVIYCIDDKEYTRVYPVNYDDRNEVMNDIIQIISKNNINRYGINFSKPYITDRSKSIKKDDIILHLSSNINKNISKETPLNLTL